MGCGTEGVAISPKAVTAIQAANMTRGTTGVCVLAAQAGAKVHVIDVGIDSETAARRGEYAGGAGLRQYCPRSGDEP
ncbi:nicotinate-nucleotide--dimethylbenzimidazole phosphoribosyltransferase [Klebsiella pneumoniae]|uniref:Nicotinate-nucleotide--dimethylbenzimidazole phosphoribosyltransferase n=1 Tax=Klebsiella pneumoniae TaxID=573 RepID=A0A2X1RH48_KLEPN|nr:nicotinate-nucleotide--dimethylbenzimidazole phosphoribosyltransferase [Klebsiella pneumoniae]